MSAVIDCFQGLSSLGQLLSRKPVSQFSLQGTARERWQNASGTLNALNSSNFNRYQSGETPRIRPPPRSANRSPGERAGSPLQLLAVPQKSIRRPLQLFGTANSAVFHGLGRSTSAYEHAAQASEFDDSLARASGLYFGERREA